LGCQLDGDGTIDVVRVASLADAGPGDITFLHTSKYASQLATTRASAVIAHESVAAAPCAILRTTQPYLAFADALALLSAPHRPEPGISPLASVAASAHIGAEVFIGPFVCIGADTRISARVILEPHVVIGRGVSIGADSILRAHVSVRDGVEIGARVHIQDGAVIGSDGYGFARRPDGTHQKIPQGGRVVLEDDVEIGAQTAIDRPAVGETRIGQGTKIDNLVQIAHGVHLGRNVLMAAQSGVAGSTTIGDAVVSSWEPSLSRPRTSAPASTSPASRL
jgi:UDP-3-O-[3-hydroxymyristoyl] glucosamine N-acyltransferase